MKTHTLTYTPTQIESKLSLIDEDTDGSVKLKNSLKIGNQILTEKLIETLSKIEAAGTKTFGTEDN